MAVLSDRPYRNSNFLVDFGWGDSRSVAAGFSEVIFPPFTADQADLRQDGSMTNQAEGSAAPAVNNRLILKRGVTGSLDLYIWWNKARLGKASKKRTVKIELLGDDRSTVVLTWRFRSVRPVSLSYSPLRAVESGIILETIELAFDSMEMS